MRTSQCEYCGDDLGYTEERRYGDEPIVCGKSGCRRYAREEMRGRQEEAAERAYEDGYSAYGGYGRW